MTNINCSARCVHQRNGKCTLSHIPGSSTNIGYGTSCAYFVPAADVRIPPVKVQM